MKLKKTMSVLVAIAMLATSYLSFGSMSAAADETDDTEVKTVDTLTVGDFSTYPTYAGGDLGANYTPEKTTFKVWAPTATSVTLKTYSKGSEEGADKDLEAWDLEYDMTLDKETGVWSVEVSGDQKNVYYTYFVKNELNPNGVEVVDIYAKAAGANGNRGMVVDLDATDPAGWENDTYVLAEEPTDAVVWEAHIKDFSYDPESGVSEANRGKYLAFTEFQTTLNNAGDFKTCMNYLKDLGVSYIQINPMYDFGSVDETGDDTQFNWGYDPKNYNVPEGSYSSNPYDGNVRITEMKQMIQALHQNGIGVIMDVVYNHTYASEDSWFNLTQPGYYYRFKDYEKGQWSNGSGCGNDTASEREMFKNFMVDSVTYWAKEYHLDGFRFDLMGLHDCDTMDAVRESLDTIDTRIIMYGEGWSLGTATDKYNWAGNKTTLCTQIKATRVSERIGFFNDDARDAIKGKAFDDLTSSGFVSGAKSFARPLFDSIKGHFTTANWKTQVPGQNVMYSCCHDNQTLYDRLVATNFGVETDQYGVRRESLVSNNKLAGAIVMTSQGIPFILAGEEFARTKYGDHNSYKSSPDINMLDWSRAADYADIVSYYKGLISLRKNFDAFSDGTQTTGESLTMMQDLPAGVIGYEIKNLASAKNQWSSALVYFNASLDEEQEIVLPGGAPEPSDGTSGVLGDPDGDGKVTNKDALLVLRYTINLAKLDDDQLALCDVNGDGKVTAADSMLIQRYVLKLADFVENNGEYVVVVDKYLAGATAINTVSGKILLAPNSALILVPKSSFDKVNFTDEKAAVVEVKHVEKDTGKVLSETMIKGHAGDPYTTGQDNDLLIVYDLDSTSNNTEGTMKEGVTTVYYYYMPFPGGIGTLTVRHVDQDGKDLCDPLVSSARNGTEYKTAPKTFPWYDLDNDNYPANAEGVYVKEGVEVVYHYIYNKPERTDELVESHFHLKIINGSFEPNLYLWDDEGGEIPEAKAWPGIKLTADANGWYNFTFHNYNTYKWIVNGDGGQTADMVGSGDLWVVCDGKPQNVSVYKENPFGDADKPADDDDTPVETPDTADTPKRTDELVSSTIYVKVDDDAFVPYIYIWDPKGVDLPDAAKWPGVKLEDADGDGWYEFTFQNYNVFCWILNDGKDTQTADMTGSGDIWVVAHAADDVSVYTEKPNT